MSHRAHQVLRRKQMPIKLVVPRISKSNSHNVKQKHDCSCLELCLGLSLHWKTAPLCYTKIPTNLPSQVDLVLKAFYADLTIPKGKMGQPPLPRAQWYAEACYPFFPPLQHHYAAPPGFFVVKQLHTKRLEGPCRDCCFTQKQNTTHQLQKSEPRGKSRTAAHWKQLMPESCLPARQPLLAPPELRQYLCILPPGLE